MLEEADTAWDWEHNIYLKSRHVVLALLVLWVALSGVLTWRSHVCILTMCVHRNYVTLELLPPPSQA